MTIYCELCQPRQDSLCNREAAGDSKNGLAVSRHVNAIDVTCDSTLGWCRTVDSAILGAGACQAFTVVFVFV